MTSPQQPAVDRAHDSTLRHLTTAALYTVVTVVLLGLIYPAVIWGIAAVAFNYQANGSLIERNGVVIGSELVGQNFGKPQYFAGRPSAAGKGNDPTQTGGTNLGPTSKKLRDSTKSAIAALRKANPDSAALPVPADLVTSSASGIDPDISPEGAYYQVPRVAKARGLSADAVRAIVAAHVTPRQLGFLGEPRANVLELNQALDAQRAAK